MPTTRRSFLIASGAFITACFVQEATACTRETGRALLVPPPAPSGTLFVYFSEDGQGGLITLGRYAVDAPLPAPIWLEHLRGQGHQLEQSGDAELVCSARRLAPADLRQRIDPQRWQGMWDHDLGPAARAYTLLKKINLATRLKDDRHTGEVSFNQYQHPGSSDRWAEAADLLSVSLLQARLRELDLPLEVRIAEA